MGKKKLRKIGIVLLAATIGSNLVGCGNSTEKQIFELNDIVKNEQTTTESTGTGRYVEKVTELSQESAISEEHSLTRCPDGTLLLCANNGECYESKDKGTTWNLSETIGFTDLLMDNYVLESAIAPDGTVALAYVPNKEETEGDSEFIMEGMDNNRISPLYSLILPDGTKHEFTMNLSDEEMYVSSFYFDDQCRLFAGVYSGNIYEINTQTGESSLFLSADDTVMNIQVLDGIMMCVMYEQLAFYDMEKKEVIEDEILHSFIKEHCSMGDFDAGYGFLGKDNAVYIACDKGLYRHIIGGNAMEQVVDGNLSTFGNPAYQLITALELDNQEFVVVFNSGRVVHYVYDADVLTIPSDKLSIYSLQNSSSVKQTIMEFQTANPDMFVEYEIGMEDNATTREDALKKLNTRLLDGSGPDIILLDELPYQSYVEKGILLDIKDVVTQISQTQELFTNLLEPFYENGSLYALPMEFKLPVMGGKKDIIANAKDYKGIAQTMETLRADNPTGNLIFPCSEQGILKLFSVVCEPAWKNEDGTMNEDAVKEYLIQSKRIYDAQLKGLTQDDIDEYEQMLTEYMEWEGIDFEESHYFTMPETVNYMSGREKIICGEAGDLYVLMNLFSMGKNKGFENESFGIMNGQSTNVYHPKNVIGINASSANQEKAIAFLRQMLSTEQQKQLHEGFPINKEALKQMLVADPNEIDSDGTYSMWSSEDKESGISVDGITYWITEEEKEIFLNWIAQLKTPLLKDPVLEQAVFQAGSKYICGDQDIDATMQNIMDSINIYMTE